MIQCQFLNRLLDSQDTTLLTSNNLTVEYFSDYVDEYNYISSHISAYGKVPDKETFLAQFRHFDVVKVTETNDYLLKALSDDRNKRHLADTFNKVRDLVNADRIDEAIKLYRLEADTIAQNSVVQSIDIFEDQSRYDVYVDKINDYKKYYVSTGFTELDQILGGWDRQEEYATIMARPGVGKSFCLIHTAIAAARQGLRVGIYSGEMSETLVGYRIDTDISHLPIGKILHGNSDIQVDYKRYLENVKKDIKGTIRILTPSMLGDLAGVTALRTFIERDKLDMLCIDQHSLLEDDRKATNPVTRAANISKDIKKLQTLTHIPIITVSQQNREKIEDGKVASTANVSDSDRKGQDSTTVIALDQKEGVMTLTLIKVRNGVAGKSLKYAVDLGRGIWTFIPEEGDATGGAHCEELHEEYDYSDVDGDDVF